MKVAFSVSKRTRGMSEYNGKFAVDFNSGFAATAGAEGLKTTLLQRQLWTPALAIILSQSSRCSILNYGHHHLREEMPVFTIPNKNMFICSFHENNDSHAVRAGQDFDYQPLDEFSIRYFKKTFNLDEDAIKKAWSAS